MEWIPVTDLRFRPYGQVLEGYDFTGFFQVMGQRTPLPEDGTVYVPSLAELEALPVAGQLRDRGFGGLEVQVGYCNGTNFRLTCLEYHRTSEIDIACDDMVLLLARQPELEEDFTLDTGRVQAFFVPAGTAVELFATTLHYAPCGTQPGRGFRMGCVLPRGTNLDSPLPPEAAGEGRLLAGRNKWVIAGPDTQEAAQGCFVGLRGPGIDLLAPA